VPTPRPQGNNNNNNSGGGPQGGTTRTDATPREGIAIPELGLTIAAARERASGVDLFNVSPHGAGFEAGVSEGDVLLAIGSKPVTSVEDVRSAIAAAKQNGDKNVILRIQSGQSFAFLAVPLG
jgi:serine protease Do